MAELNAHWTQDDDGFLYSIATDFVRHLEDVLERGQVTRSEFARKLGVSQGRVSQVLNNPGNLTLKQIIKYAKAMGEKVAIISYDDGDPENLRGPIVAEIFSMCWERAGRPKDFFAFESEDHFMTGETTVSAQCVERLDIASLQSIAATTEGGREWQRPIR